MLIAIPSVGIPTSYCYKEEGRFQSSLSRTVGKNNLFDRLMSFVTLLLRQSILHQELAKCLLVLCPLKHQPESCAT